MTAHLLGDSGCTLPRPDWRCSLWPGGENRTGPQAAYSGSTQMLICQPAEGRRTYRERRVFVQLVFSGDAEASVVAAGGPGQSHRRLQLVVHLMVDGAAELCPVVTARKAFIRTGSFGRAEADSTQLVLRLASRLTGTHTHTLVCSWKSPALYPRAKLFWVSLDLAVSKAIW